MTLLIRPLIRNIFYLFLISFAFSSPLFAQEEAAPPKKKTPRLRPWLELSVMGSISRSSFGNGSFSKSRRLTGSVGLYVTNTTEFEVSYTDQRTTIDYAPAPRNVTSTEDKTLSASLVQTIVPRSWFFQPFAKAGAAQLNRKQDSIYNDSAQPQQTLKQPSGLLGAGLRFYLTSVFSIKFEYTAYLPHFQLRGAKENYEWDAGVSLTF